MTEQREHVVKARLVGPDAAVNVKGSGQLDPEHLNLFVAHGALEPPYDLEELCHCYEHSAALRPSVDSYATNVDGFGHRLEPAFDLHSDEHRRRIMAALRRSGKLQKADNNAEDGTPTPAEEEIKELMGAIGDEMIAEKTKLEFFLKNCCTDYSFVKLRRKTRQDMEVTGNAYWEVIRNRGEQIAELVYMASHTVRLLPIDQKPTTISFTVYQDDLSSREIKRKKRFRRFVQIVNGDAVFFKELGDPRLISNKTGRVFESVEQLKEEDGDEAEPANEVMHFTIDSPSSPYGVPRWIGSLISVKGSRASEEVNFLYFDNKSVPPLAVLVSGGRVSEESVKRIESFIETEIRGRQNFHKILILEAEPAAGVQQTENSARMKIEIRPLTAAQHNDALFQKYDERNHDKIGSMFRLPRLLRGDIRDFNRSTAMAALNFAEMQVFQPEREDFDWDINHKLFVEMGVRYWTFVSRAPVTRDPVALSEMIRNLANSHVLIPEEARELAADAFNREFKKLEVEWTKQPMSMTLAGMSGGVPGVPNGQPQIETAKRVLKLRAWLEKAEEEAFDAHLRAGLDLENLPREVIRVPADKMRELVDGSDDTSATE